MEAFTENIYIGSNWIGIGLICGELCGEAREAREARREINFTFNLPPRHR